MERLARLALVLLLGLAIGVHAQNWPGCALSSLSGTQFSLPTNNELRCTNLSLTALPTWLNLERFENLKILNLSNNHISTLPAEAFGNLEYLEHLYLVGNRITSLNEYAFGYLSSLRSLHLSSNRLKSIPVDMFSDLNSLQTLTLTNNNFSSIDFDVLEELNDLSNFRALYLMNNSGFRTCLAIRMPSRSDDEDEYGWDYEGGGDYRDNRYYGDQEGEGGYGGGGDWDEWRDRRRRSPDSSPSPDSENDSTPSPDSEDDSTPSIDFLIYFGTISNVRVAGPANFSSLLCNFSANATGNHSTTIKPANSSSTTASNVTAANPTTVRPNTSITASIVTTLPANATRGPSSSPSTFPVSDGPTTRPPTGNTSANMASTTRAASSSSTSTITSPAASTPPTTKASAGNQISSTTQPLTTRATTGAAAATSTASAATTVTGSTTASSTTPFERDVVMLFEADADSTDLVAFARAVHVTILNVTGLSTSDVPRVIASRGSIVVNATTTSQSAHTALTNAIASIVVLFNGQTHNAQAVPPSGNAQQASGSSASSMSPAVFGAIGGVLALVAIVALAVLLARRRSRNRVQTTHARSASELQQPPFTALQTNPLYKMAKTGAAPVARHAEVGSHVTYDNAPSLELDRARLRLGRAIGQGEFGLVYDGLLLGRDTENVTRVAIKVLKTGASESDREEFLEEMRLMCMLDSVRVVRLLGVCIAGEPAMIVEEFLANGNLHTFLSKARPLLLAGRPAVTAAMLLQSASDTAEGMAYIASQGLVHRDLAARNLLLDEEHRCKIADFGLSRESEATDGEALYQARTTRRLPLRWIAVEALEAGAYTTASDVWAFGVTLWEMVHFARTPYPRLANTTVAEKVCGGYRMPVPAFVSGELASVMRRCWAQRTTDRPSFESLTVALRAMLAAASEHIDLTHPAFRSEVLEAADDSTHAYAAVQALEPSYEVPVTYVRPETLLASPQYTALADYDFAGSESHYEAANAGHATYAIASSITYAAVPPSNARKHRNEQPVYALGDEGGANTPAVKTHKATPMDRGVSDTLYDNAVEGDGLYAPVDTQYAEVDANTYALADSIIGTLRADPHLAPHASEALYSIASDGTATLPGTVINSQRLLYSTPITASAHVSKNPAASHYDNLGESGDHLYAPPATAYAPVPKGYLDIVP